MQTDLNRYQCGYNGLMKKKKQLSECNPFYTCNFINMPISMSIMACRYARAYTHHLLTIMSVKCISKVQTRLQLTFINFSRWKHASWLCSMAAQKSMGAKLTCPKYLELNYHQLLSVSKLAHSPVSLDIFTSCCSYLCDCIAACSWNVMKMN